MSGKRMRRVLVIDDEPDMAEWLALTVTGAGYDVRVATRGAEAERCSRAGSPTRRWWTSCCPMSTAPTSCAASRAAATDRSPGHQRTGQHPARRRGHQGRRDLLPRKADRRRERAGDAGPRDRTHRARSRERRAAPAAAGSLSVREHHRAQPQDARAVRPGGRRRRLGSEHPDSGRERHGQGADRQRDSLQQPAREGPVHQDQLRGDSQGPDRGRAVRPSARRLHRRDPGSRRAAGAGPGRVAAARRDRRDAAVPADQAACACCRSASTGPWAATASCAWTSGSSARPTSIWTQRSRTGGSARICTSASTPSRCACRRCASAPKTSRCCAIISSIGSGSGTSATCGPSRRRRITC